MASVAQGPRLREPGRLVSPRARLVWAGLALTQSVGAFGVLLLATLAWHWFGLQLWMLLALGVVALAYVIGMPQWRYRVHRWEVTDTAVYTQRGWLSRERRIAPLSRVQTVDVHRGPISQLFGLSSVTVTTASAAGPLRIEGLDRRVADEIVDDLTARADAEVGDAT